MILSRRTILAAAGAALIPRAGMAQGAGDRALRGLLDAAAVSDAPAAMADRLARIDPTRLSPSARFDLITALSGLRIDAELARLSPDRSGPMTPARYRLLLRRLTSDDADPAAILRRLERERRALSARADRIMRRLGRGSGSVGARYSALWRDPAGLYDDDDAGRDRAIADMNHSLSSVRAAALRDLPQAPSWCFDVAVRRMSIAEEVAGRSGYRELPTATRSGAYVVDLKQIARRPSWTLPSVVHHELLPGHMIQLPIEALVPPHPLRLRYAAGFSEGWAIHAERTALDRGDYADDPMGALGCLHWLLFRVGRALIDLRLHLSGWTPERARAQIVAWQGEPAYFAPFDQDIARIVATPGLRVAEAVAWLTLDNIMHRNPAAMNHAALKFGSLRNDVLGKLAMSL